MSRVNLFRLLLTVPLAVPLSIVGIAFVLGDPYRWYALLAYGYLAYSGVPYAVLALAGGFWSRQKSARQLRRASLLLPLLFLPLIWLWVFIAERRALIRVGLVIREASEIALIAVAVGYCYVAIGLALEFLFFKRPDGETSRL